MLNFLRKIANYKTFSLRQNPFEIRKEKSRLQGAKIEYSTHSVNEANTDKRMSSKRFANKITRYKPTK